MHGFALHQAISRFDRQLVGQMASKKALNMVCYTAHEDDVQTKWSRFEHLSVREKV